MELLSAGEKCHADSLTDELICCDEVQEAACALWGGAGCRMVPLRCRSKSILEGGQQQVPD